MTLRCAHRRHRIGDFSSPFAHFTDKTHASVITDDRRERRRDLRKKWGRCPAGNVNDRRAGAARRAFRAARRSFTVRKLNRLAPFDVPEARAQGKVDEATFWHAGGAATRGGTVTQYAHEKILPVAKKRDRWETLAPRLSRDLEEERGRRGGGCARAGARCLRARDRQFTLGKVGLIVIERILLHNKGSLRPATSDQRPATTLGPQASSRRLRLPRARAEPVGSGPDPRR